MDEKYVIFALMNKYDINDLLLAEEYANEHCAGQECVFIDDIDDVVYNALCCRRQKPLKTPIIVFKDMNAAKEDGLNVEVFKYALDVRGIMVDYIIPPFGPQKESEIMNTLIGYDIWMDRLGEDIPWNIENEEDLEE